MAVSDNRQRVVSGMRPTGLLHLGHYYGVLKNWLELQEKYQCWYFVADWHALTTHYKSSNELSSYVYDTLIEWLATGIDPNKANIFVQSMVPEHAELYLLLSMMTPISWLTRVPTYKDTQIKNPDKELSTYGFLGYPLLQSADILMYRAGLVPVGEDQVAHVEITREIARSFNHLYGSGADFNVARLQAIKKMPLEQAAIYQKFCRRYKELGDKTIVDKAKVLLAGEVNLSAEEGSILMDFLQHDARSILPEPQVLLTDTPKVVGLNGEKMSKSQNNTINLTDTDEQISTKLKKMQTDPARVRRTDPGNPENCPVWSLHKLQTDEETRVMLDSGCRSAGIGCMDCKKILIENVQASVAPIREKSAELRKNPDWVREIAIQGSKCAQQVARETLNEVRVAMGITY